MPLLIDRRRFLRDSFVSAAGLAFASHLSASTQEIQVALLSDTHIAANPEDRYRGFSPHENLRKVCTQLDAAKLGMLLVNGDLARKTGQSADYAALGKYLDPMADRMPLVLTLGNHDDRKNARSALTKRTGDVQPVEQKLVSVVDAGPVRFVLLDSLMVTDIPAGQLGKKQREWLSSFLAAQTEKPVVVFVHHNPDRDDDNGLVDASPFLSLLGSNRAVKALFFGHTHVYKIARVGGLHLVNLPAVGYNFADGNPVGWVESTFTGTGVRLQLHAIAGQTRNDGAMTELSWT